MGKFIFAFVLGLTTLSFTTVMAQSGVTTQTSVTWRAGDMITYRNGCNSIESISHIAMIVAGLEERREVGPTDCFRLTVPIPATLTERVSSSFEHKANGSRYSIWRILDSMDDVEYTLVPDSGGPHKTDPRT